MNIKKFKEQLKVMSQQDALNAIAEEMDRPGADRKALDTLLGDVLGIKLAQYDPELLGEFEAQWRGKT